MLKIGQSKREIAIDLIAVLSISKVTKMEYTKT